MIIVPAGQRLAAHGEALPVGGGHGAAAEHPGQLQAVVVVDDAPCWPRAASPPARTIPASRPARRRGCRTPRPSWPGPGWWPCAISTARMLRLSSATAGLLAAARVGEAVQEVRSGASSSISSEAIGANGSIPASSSLSSLASAGTSSAVSGGITSLSSASSRTVPVSSGSAPARVFSSSASAAWSSSLPCASASAALAGLPTSRQYSALLGRPLRRGVQVGRRVGVAARPGHEHVPGAQPVPQAQDHAQLPVVPEGGVVTGLAGLVQVVGVPGRHERGRAHRRGPSGRRCAFSFFKIATAVIRSVVPGPPVKVDRCQHVRGELPQVGVGGVHRRQPAMVLGQRLPRCPRRPPAAAHPDPLPQEPADLLVRDRRVGQHRQDHIHQQLPGLALLGPLGQRLVGLGPRPRLPRRHRLVEQRDDLIELVDRRLRHQRQQDRVPALLAPLQRLHRGPAAHRGQEPAPLARQHRQVQQVGVHVPQVDQLARSRSSPRSRSPPPPAWSATPASSSPARHRYISSTVQIRSGPARSAGAPPAPTSAPSRLPGPS